MAYAAASLVMTGRSAMIAAMLIGGIAVAAWIRVRIITTDLKRLDDLISFGRLLSVEKEEVFKGGPGEKERREPR
jgi:hypothetical protein